MRSDTQEIPRFAEGLRNRNHGDSIMAISKRPLNTFAFAVLPAALTLLSACTGVSRTTKEQVAQTQAAVQQAQGTIGTSESGALELQRAREQLAAAQRAVEGGKEGQALRHANEAQLSAELAIAKSQSAAARKAAEDTIASLETLRKEAARDQPASR
jgi:hypothetical protein